MKKKTFFYILLLLLFAGKISMVDSCRSSRVNTSYQADTLYTNPDGKGDLIEINFRKGTEHNHPLMAIWIEDTAGNYTQTVYVAKSIAKGIFEFGDKSAGKWQPGSLRRPAALPVWSHSRGVQEDDGLFIPKEETAIPDAYTGPTPQSNFVLYARTDNTLPDQFYVYFEINQSWDWNEYWTNTKYIEDEEYKTSSQPALVYRVLFDKNVTNSKPVYLKLIGHSHYSGQDGTIYTDTNTITTAQKITESVSVRISEH